jgi:hypothetical protein
LGNGLGSWVLGFGFLVAQQEKAEDLRPKTKDQKIDNCQMITDQ